MSLGSPLVPLADEPAGTMSVSGLALKTTVESKAPVRKDYSLKWIAAAKFGK
jgi:hypothetical protein